MVGCISIIIYCCVVDYYWTMVVYIALVVIGLYFGVWHALENQVLGLGLAVVAADLCLLYIILYYVM